LPRKKASGMGPKSRESRLSSRLSPIRKYWPSGSLVGGQLRPAYFPGVKAIQWPSSFSTMDPMGCDLGTQAKIRRVERLHGKRPAVDEDAGL